MRLAAMVVLLASLCAAQDKEIGWKLYGCMDVKGDYVPCSKVRIENVDVQPIERVEPPEYDAPPKTIGPTYTCKDKSRVLLTAEDGTKHCISMKALQALEALVGQVSR